ncbi:hypothetical protein FrEUN1fDRAFT_6418 [Parafrankia sp. EUN1f]|nr:hypothetical protein FrEUN1fDRAFT_6418 [Parafrankia sp. EUN1f]
MNERGCHPGDGRLGHELPAFLRPFYASCCELLVLTDRRVDVGGRIRHISGLCYTGLVLVLALVSTILSSSGWRSRSGRRPCGTTWR